MKGQNVVLRIILAVLFIAGLCLYFFMGSVSPKVEKDTIIVESTLSADAEIMLSEIEECLLYDSVDTAMPSMAFQNFKVKCGWFSSTQFGPHKLTVYNNVEKFIILKTNDSYTVFNCKTIEATEKFYNEITEAMNSLKTEVEPDTETVPTPEITPEPTPILTPDIGGESTY
ncbi:MAG: hypothetical protein E7388_04610 [Ruminococcaceae bacterium]|nr:hypothetical protein [Oscillospiraceae bacterium]